MEGRNLQGGDLRTVTAGTLPGVSVFVLSAHDVRTRREFEERMRSCSIARFKIVFADEISPSMLELAGEDYVAIVTGRDRYLNDYALEVLVNTARCEKADVVGGIAEGKEACVSDFVFDTAWLRDNAELLKILKKDEQAFTAAALARAGKHVIRRRPYTQRLKSGGEPLVSVIVPAYNAQQYIDRCMESLVGQTHRKLEIIIVDDGSADSTAALCDEWAKKDGRIKVIHKPNGGLSSARNAGMEIATGKYIGFVDADDYVDMDMFGDLADALESHPQCDVAKCGVAVEYTYKVSEREKLSTQAYFQNPCEGEVYPRYDIVQKTSACAWDKLYRTDFLRVNGIVFPEGVENEDEAFFFAVFCRIRNCYYIHQRYYHYLRNENGIMARQKQASEHGSVPDAMRVFDYIAELLERENRRDLLGVLFRHTVGGVQRFTETPIEEPTENMAAGIFRKTRAFYYSDLICGSERLWVQRRVYELMNRWKETEYNREFPEKWFTAAPVSSSVSIGNPVLSFIVPVYNAERYISSTIESIRRQTLSDFEIICVDDGSVDDSGKILDFYAGVDSRIRVWHLENGGVSRARNFGLSKAVGKYVAFVDGDDRLLPQMAAKTVLAAECDALDAVMFDFKCFDSSTLNEIDHYWRLAHHAEHFPAERDFSPGELENLPVYGSSCTYLWNRGFLEKAGVAFPGIRLGEDLVWLLLVLSKVRRMRMVNIPFYEYRRNNPSSAVSRLQTNESDAPVYALKGLAEVLANVDDRRLRRLYLKRMVSDILFYGEKNAKARSYLQCGGFDGFGGLEYLKRVCSEREYARISALVNGEVRNDAPPDIEYFIRQTPSRIRRIMRKAIVDRKNSQKDLIVVFGQLNSITNEPIDSWTFFRWLQNKGIPCRYVVWRKHRMIDKMRTENGLKDVILLSGNGVDDYEFIEKIKDLLPRLKAVMMENTALNPLVWRYFHKLEGCDYVFLQHGVTFWKKSPPHIGSFAVANYVNTASEEEKKFLEKHVPVHWETKNKPEYLLAGLPRWDLLRDESGSEKEKVVFFMPTWRATFNSGMDALTRSAYYSEIKKLVCRENLDRLKKRGIRFLMAAHHHLVNRVKDLDFDLPVELVPTSEISYWIRHASLCITDYSSVSFDFLFLNKPCIFWTPDRYDGLLCADDYAEVVFAEHQGANMFNRVSTPEEVMAMIEKYADCAFQIEAEKRSVADRYFACRKNICERLYAQIETLGERTECK